jgi:hypothetical protein
MDLEVMAFRLMRQMGGMDMTMKIKSKSRDSILRERKQSFKHRKL